MACNIVPVQKKNVHIRVCIDYRDLNNTYLNDDFPFPLIKLLVNSTTGYEALSFMDGYSRYNQIQMVVEDKDQACQNSFDNIKKYLLNSLVLMSLELGKPLLLYIIALDSSLVAHPILDDYPL